jgi:hypothetical protein
MARRLLVVPIRAALTESDTPGGIRQQKFPSPSGAPSSALSVSDYDKLADWQKAEVEVDVLAIDWAEDGTPVLLGKLNLEQIELWPAGPLATAAIRCLVRGDRIRAHISKCPTVISNRSYGGLRRLRSRIRFSRLLDVRVA